VFGLRIVSVVSVVGVMKNVLIVVVVVAAENDGTMTRSVGSDVTSRHRIYCR
jgi:hypothetical protein